jgi:hypothetical protein
MLREVGEAVETGREGSRRARRYRSVGKCRCARCKIRAYHCGAFEVGNVATVGSSVGLLRWKGPLPDSRRVRYYLGRLLLLFTCP